MSVTPSLSLRELIDIGELQSIQDSFAKAAGISSVILSPEGEPLTTFTDPTGFCSLIQSTEKGKERCFRSFMEMAEIALGSADAEICYCFAHGGHFVAPIMIDGEHKGTMFAGQFIPEKFSSEQLHDLEEIAHEIDIDRGALVKEAEKMRVVGEDVIRNYSILLFKIVETIAKRGAQAAELERRVRERTAELAGANKGLEHEIVERKLAEDALQKERDRAQHYLDVAGVMFLVIGADRKVRLINRKGCEILGYGEEEEITGKDWFDNFIPDRLRDEVAGVFKSLMAGEIEPVEYYENPVLTKHGEERIIAWHSTILRGEQGRIYATMASGGDITERKKAEEYLRESEKKYNRLFSEMVDGFALHEIICDGDGKPIDYDTLEVNKSYEKMLGVKKEDVVGVKASQLMTAKELNEWLELFGPTALMGKSAHYEKHSQANDEYFEGVVYCPKKSQFAVTFTNITKRKKAEEELRLHAAMMDNVAEGVYLIGFDDLIIKWTNEKFERMFGYDPGDMVGKHVDIVNAPIEGTPTETRISIVDVLKETGKWHGEVRNIKRDGTHFWCSANVSLFDHPEYGKVIVSAHADITERKHAEEALRESELRYHSLTDDVLDTSSVGIFILNSDFQVVWVNHALERYFGLRRKEVIGKDKRQLIRERIKDIFEDPVYFAEKVVATYDNNTYIEHFECHTVPGRELEERWLEHWSQPIISGLYAGGRVEHYSDITERKQTEVELQERMNELETFYRVTLGREERVIELKQEVNELSEQLGKNKKYKDNSNN